VTFLGIDAGGTAVRWAVCGRDGAMVARGEAAAVTGHLFLPEARAAFEAFAGELGAAVADLRVGAAVAGITGLTGDSAEAAAARDLLSEALRLDPGRIEVQDDLWIGYHAVFSPGQGHVVYSGTGSVGMHIRADGSVLRVGGRGILIDDAGSAFAIGRSALNLVYRRIDRGEEAGALGRALFAAVGGDSWNAVRAHVYGGGRTAVALLARAVAAVGEDDPAAIAVLREAGAELAVLARALVAREGMREVVLLGRAAGLHPAIVRAMQDALPGVALRMEITDAALAAAHLACARARPGAG
jgi:N-acetylglucosamine kinase-like BadF-type ATPase